MKSSSSRRLPLCMVVAAITLSAGRPSRAQTQRVKNTVHNLSVTGPGPVRAVAETEVCIFCHTPHNATAKVSPLWNRSVSTGPYTIYESSSMRARTGQPTGASKLCLSCHDGTIALGNVLSKPSEIMMAGGISTMEPGPQNLGTDLSDDHPISFSYSAAVVSSNSQLLPVNSIVPPVSVDKNGEVQCTSCHEPHDNSFGNFLKRSNEAGALCKSCHRLSSWNTSAHATASVQVPPDVAAQLGADTAPVGENACKSCHRTHNAKGRPWILGRRNITATCLSCHTGTVAKDDVSREIVKLSNHGLTQEGVPETTGRPFLEGDRISCADCHNPHASGSPDTLAPGLPSSLARVSGVTREGTATSEIGHEYELCFRCHGDSPVRTATYVSRVIVQENKRFQFQSTNPSLHPVGIPGRSYTVPSLVPPLTPLSVITCGDCHSSNDSRAFGGSGPAGPHGSIHVPMLAFRYDTTDYATESLAAYALCYRCHQRDSILGDFSFREHKEHVVEERTPCSVCHDPHGIYSGQGTAIGNSALINFDRSVVFPNKSGRLQFVKTGNFHGSCYLSCHGEDHDPESY